MGGTILAALALTAGLASAQESMPTKPAPEAHSAEAHDTEAAKEPHQEGEAEPWLPESHHEEAEAAEEPEEPLAFFHFRADYVYWWFKRATVPPLVTTGDTTDMPTAAIGQPSTVSLFGGRELDPKKLSGGRFTVTTWLDEEMLFGLEAQGLVFESQSVTFDKSSGVGGNPVMARPFYNLATNQQDASLISYPGLASGRARIEIPTRLYGGEVDGLFNLYGWRGFSVDLLAGFRYFQMYEAVTIGEQSSVAPGTPVMGGWVFAGADNFSVRNQFYGGQLGVRTEVRNGRLFLDLQGKVAMGSVAEVLTIAGYTSVIQPGLAPQTVPGDLYALASNIGRYSHSSFAVLPEGDVNVGWEVVEHVQVRFGYSFLCCSRVIRPGEQIDPNLNPNLIPGSLGFGLPGGPARPIALMHETSFWVQGLNFGVGISY